MSRALDAQKEMAASEGGGVHGDSKRGRRLQLA